MRALGRRKNLFSWIQAAGVALLLVAASFALLPGHASAAAPRIGVLLSPGDGTGAIVPADGTITDQTTVEVQVPDNTTLSGSAAVKILECSDADGMTDDLPKSAVGCDGLTINTGATINEDGNGGVDAFNYVIYALPSAALHENSNATPVCDAYSACVLYIGENQNDFSTAYVWSTPFCVAAVGATAQTGICGTTPPTTPTVTAVSPNAGPPAGGTAVTITGTGFSTASGSTTVDFGTGNPGTAVTCSSTTSCTATSPAGSAATVDVTVTVGGATSTTSTADKFTYASSTTTTTTTTSDLSTGASDTGSGTGSSDTSSSDQLASTGTPGSLVWLVAGGGILLAAGSIGRRRFSPASG